MRGVPSEDFGSLQLIIVGAEKLSERLADAFEQYFGIRPLEGYGTTECAPAVAVNIMDFRAAGFHQIGGKRGKIGRVLPGMMARLDRPGRSVGRQTSARRRTRHVARARAERDARLSRPAGKNGGRVAARLVLHRRRGHGGRGRFPADHRPPEPVQQNRRRNGAAFEDRGEIAGTRGRGGDDVCGGRRAG